MTIFMMESFKYLPQQEKYPLPPRVISMNIAQEAGIRKNLSEDQRFAITLVNHFAYGALAAFFYFPLAKNKKVSNQVSGIGYGLFVWGINYLGFLPQLKLYRKPAKETFKRNIMMILAHVVWGSSLGLLQSLSDNSKKRL